MSNSVNWKKNLAVMWFAQLTGMGAITGVLAFLPLYIPELGVTNVEMWSGILLAVSSLFAALFGPHWGIMADRRGRKPMVERVMIAFFVLMVAMAYVTNVYQLLVLRIIQGIFGGFTAAALALVTSFTPPEYIAFALGIYQTAMIVGGAFGPLFGGLVADYLGFRQAFVAFGLLCLVSLITIRFWVTENFTPEPVSAKPSFFSEIRHVLTLPGLVTVLVVQFLIYFAIQAVAPVLPLYVQSLSPNASFIASTCGAIIAAAGLTSAIASASMGHLSKRFAHSTILVAALSMSAVSFAAQAVAPTVGLLGAGRALSGFFMGAMLPSVNAIITETIPPEKRGVAYGVTTAAMQFGNVAGPITGGAMALCWGIPSVFWFTTVIFALTAVWVKRNIAQHSQAE